MFLPSISSLVGLRNASGYEIAMGPNLSLSGISYVLAAGKNIKVGGLNIPVNVSWVPAHSDSSHRMSMTASAEGIQRLEDIKFGQVNANGTLRDCLFKKHLKSRCDSEEK